MEWKDIAKTVGKAAPLIGTLLAPATGGASVAIGALVSSALGVDNTPEAVELELRNNPDALLKIKELEFQENESLRKQVIDLNKLENEKYIESHKTYQVKNEMADKIAFQIITRNLPLIGILVFINVAVVYYFREYATLIAIVSNVIGVAIGNLFNERQAVINFFMGSSLGSKQKTEQLNKVVK